MAVNEKALDQIKVLQMSEKNLVASIHPSIHSNPQNDPYVGALEKVTGFIKGIRIPPLGIVDICTQSHCNPSNSR